MAYSDPKLAHFTLRGRGIDELRTLGSRFLGREDSALAQMSKVELIGELSEAAASSVQLSRELRKGSISVKPSFYLMRFSDEPKPELAAVRPRLARYLQQRSSGLKNLQVQLTSESQTDVIEVFLTWHSSYSYWAPTFAMSQVEQLEFGFAVLDYRVCKAILACHTVKERDEITKLLADGFGVRFSALVLTKPVLEQIGGFDNVKRALYAINKPDPATPANITYADENLAARSLARDEEDNPSSQRIQSFYRIPIADPLIEEGVGATSESGKLWIPKEIPLDSIREYCAGLLSKISGTLNKMARRDEIEAVLDTFNFNEMPELASADPLSFRECLAQLLRAIVIMLSRKEEERPFTVPFEMIRYGAPRFFFTRILLVDPDTGEVGAWSDAQYQSPGIMLSGSHANFEIRSFPGRAPIDLSALVHPITGSAIAIDNVMEHLDVAPTEQFLKIARQVVSRVSGQIAKLKAVKNLAFRISRNIIVLDVQRSFGDPASHVTLISTSDIDELQSIIQRQSIAPSKRAAVQARLVELGEKCVHMSDENCKTCIKDKDKLCLRSLLGRHLKNTEILAHKGIELSDLSCRGTVGGREHRMWGFAKLPSGRGGDKGLTVRNKPGAVLLAQVMSQLDKTTFRTVLIVSPSAVNQDFQERAEVLCSLFGKELCFVDADDLGRLLLDFEEQAPFDGLDVQQIYRYSRTKKRPKKTV